LWLSLLLPLGVTFTVDYTAGAGETKFEDKADLSITQATFNTAAPVNTLVKVKDKLGSGITGTANEIDIETP